MSKPSLYLGANLDFNTTKKYEVFRALIKKIHKTFQHWKCGLLNMAGQCTLARYVPQSIPICFFSFFKIPKYVLDKLSSIIQKVFCGSYGSKGFCWQNWNKICLPLPWRGLGLRNLGYLNQALLAKQALLDYQSLKQSNTIALQNQNLATTKTTKQNRVIIHIYIHIYIYIYI